MRIERWSRPGLAVATGLILLVLIPEPTEGQGAEGNSAIPRTPWDSGISLGVGPALDGSGQHLSEWSPDASDEAVPIFFRHRLLDELSRLFPALGIVS